ILCQRLDFVLVQFALLDDLLNEVPLFGGAVPGAVVGPLGMTSAGVRAAAALPTSIAVRCRQIPGLLDTAVNAVLEQFVESGALGLNLRHVCDLGPEGDAELMGTIAGQTQLLAVVAFECDH